jgi:hypothetical protein
MQNMQPVSISGGNARVLANMPTISGGLTPAALDPTTREHGGALLRAALLAQLSGSDVPAATDFRGGVLDAPAATDFRAGILRTPDMPDYSGAVLTPPTLGGYRQPGKGESWSSGGGIVGGILGALLPAIIDRGKKKGK